MSGPGGGAILGRLARVAQRDIKKAAPREAGPGGRRGIAYPWGRQALRFLGIPYGL